jgi:hypothetical protein
MKRSLGVTLAAALVCVLNGPTRADDAGAIIDKAIKALGGEEALTKAGTASWKTKGVLTFGGNENEFTTESTAQGLDRHRSEFAGNFDGNDFRAVSVLNGDKGWRKFADNVMELGGDDLANEKRMIYLQVVPSTIVALKGNGFKAEVAGEETVGDKPAVVLKVTGPDGKDFKLSLDKESGLPVKQVADVVGWMGEQYTQEVTYSNYKDFGGIKRATKIEVKRDGEPILKQELTEFTVLDSVPADTFAEPK